MSRRHPAVPPTLFCPGCREVYIQEKPSGSSHLLRVHDGPDGEPVQIWCSARDFSSLARATICRWALNPVQGRAGRAGSEDGGGRDPKNIPPSHLHPFGRNACGTTSANVTVSHRGRLRPHFVRPPELCRQKLKRARTLKGFGPCLAGHAGHSRHASPALHIGVVGFVATLASEARTCLPAADGLETGAAPVPVQPHDHFVQADAGSRFHGRGRCNGKLPWARS